MDDNARRWFDRSTSTSRDWPLEQLLAEKNDTRISVVIPARDEQTTIGAIVAGIKSKLMDQAGLVDELVVIDSDSRDHTAAIATEHGAFVYAAREIAPELGAHPGKGEALWKSLFVTTGDLLVFIDADLTEWGTHFVTGLLGPLLADPAVALVKGFYDRVLDDGNGRSSLAGGRVTELVARPLLSLFHPQLAAVVQPLAGEWAIRRAAFEQLAVPVGYGVELAALLDIYDGHGLDAIAQVDLGSRAHVHQAEHDLAVMAAELLHVTATHFGWDQPTTPRLAQFVRGDQTTWRERDVPAVRRAPAVSTARYTARANPHPAPQG